MEHHLERALYKIVHLSSPRDIENVLRTLLAEEDEICANAPVTNMFSIQDKLFVRAEVHRAGIKT